MYSRPTGALLAVCLLFAGSSRAHAGEPEPEPPPIQQPAPASIVDPEAPPSAEVEPASDALPGYDHPLAVPADPPLREVPPDGRGLLASGSLLLTAGVAFLISGSLLSVDGDTKILTFAPILGVGIFAPIAGSLLLGIGAHRHRAYRSWKADQTEPIPPQGTGLVAPGAVFLVAGTATTVLAGVLSVDTLGPPPGAAPMVGIGLTSMAVGATLMGIGAHRHKRFGAWRSETSGLARVQLAPTFVFMPGRSSRSRGRGAMQLGLSGRF